MLGLGKTGTVRAPATASSARSQDIYQHYAAALYRQALLAPDDSALAEHVARDALVNECALAAMPVLGIHQRDMAALLRAVLRKLTTSPAAAVEDGGARCGGSAWAWPVRGSGTTDHTAG